jgi:tetratricopeptide (TPR) repeat protein
MTIFKKKGTGALILIMCALALIGTIIAIIYYKNKNRSVDPRIIEAREMYERYNAYGQANNFDGVFALMDSIENIYTSVEHYSNSFEVGVLYNNRAATFLTMAFYHDDYMHDSAVVDSLVDLAELATNKSISIYKSWIEKFERISEEELPRIITDNFLKGLESYSTKEQEKFLEMRVSEILQAQLETSRRLSVSLTNLGVIYRHRAKYEEAIKYYSEALDLWDQNLTAENNINVLLGRPKKERTMIQKLFPPERK